MLVKEKGYLKSRFFRKLFLSYVLLILVFVAVYCIWYLYAYQQNYRSSMLESCWQKAYAFGTESDRDLLTAQSLCGAINTSDTLRNLYQTLHIEKKTVDSMLLYRVLSEMKHIKSFAASLDVYSIMLGFSEDNRLYTSGSVIALEDSVTPPVYTPWIGVTSAADLMNVHGTTNILLNKQYLIYADSYTGATGASSKGVTLVLTDISSLLNRVEALLPFFRAVEIRSGRNMIYASQPMNDANEILSVDSLTSAAVSYRFQLSDEALRPPFHIGVFAPLALTVLAGLVFMYLSYHYLKRRYQPIGAISQMVSDPSAPAKPKDDLEEIMRGIADLIGERNGYKEKMITLSPYASHGALHQLLSGNMHGDQMEILQEEQFGGLRSGFYVVGLVNLAISAAARLEQRFLDARTLAAHACSELSSEEHTVVTCAKDLSNLYVVVNGDHPEQLNDLFYEILNRITEAVDDRQISVTVGVSSPQTELEDARTACREAGQALENMLTGGRGSVYFFADPEKSDEEKEYDFPKDMQKRIVRDLRENNPEDLNALLDGIWEKNVRHAALSPDTLRHMVDEMHACISAALREISEKSTTHLRIDRVTEPATIEETFSYYRSILSQAVRTCQEEVMNDADSAELGNSICEYINQNLFNPDMSLSGVADHFGVSGKLVGTVCKNAFGKTYLQYVRDCQIQHAVKLLQTTDLPLEEIAAQCGFSNLLTFRRNFKAAMNMNPSDFRK